MNGSEMRHAFETRAEKELAEFKALFVLAGINIDKVYELQNGYWPNHPDYFTIATPWYLMKTDLGLIKIGWRKRVISINWEDTSIRKKVTEDEVTKDDKMVHAWKLEDAVKYLKALKE